MTDTKNSNREFEYDAMRAVAAITVVVIHVCAMQWRSLIIHSAQWITLTVWDMLCKFSVPLFFMISGRFNLDDSHSPDIRTIVTKKTPRLAVAFVFWSLIYTVLNLLRTDSIAENWKWITVEFITGEYHMWFLFAIAALYLITPLLKSFTSDKKLTEFFIVLFFAFQLILPSVIKLPHIGVVFEEISDKMQFKFVLGYTGYYILGWYLKRYKLSANIRRICYVFGIIGTVFSIVSVIKLSWSTGVADETSADYLTWNVAAETVSIYLLFQQFGRRSFKRINKQISYIAKYSFGIYLSHPLILSLFTFIDFFPTFITPIIGVPLFTVVTILLSLIVSWAIRRIPRIGSLVT